MTKDVRAKTFKSGNSVALRLPKVLGIKEGVEMKVREEQGRYVVEPVDRPKRKIDLTGIAGACPGLKPLTSAEREIDPTPGIEELMKRLGWKKAR
jgi:antitoxin VapB